MRVKRPERQLGWEPNGNVSSQHPVLAVESSRMSTVRDAFSHADQAVERGKSCWQISKVLMLMPKLVKGSHPRRHSHAAARATKPVQYAVTFSLLPTMDSSSQKKASWPVSFAPTVAYARYSAADPILANRWVGTGCSKGQSRRWKRPKEVGPPLPQVVSCCSGSRTRPRPREPGRHRG